MPLRRNRGMTDVSLAWRRDATLFEHAEREQAQ
jgi:hypothetical protein